ncbi:hypothetical protein D3C76_1669810 [compost metagenome]
MEHPEMQIRLAVADFLGNLEILAPVLVVLQSSHPGDDGIMGDFAGNKAERVDIYDVGNDIAVQPGADGNK